MMLKVVKTVEDPKREISYNNLAHNRKSDICRFYGIVMSPSSVYRAKAFVSRTQWCKGKYRIHSLEWLTECNLYGFESTSLKILFKQVLAMDYPEVPIIYQFHTSKELVDWLACSN